MYCSNFMYGIFVSAMRRHRACPNTAKDIANQQQESKQVFGNRRWTKIFSISCNLHSSQSMRTPTTCATSSLAVLQFHELRHHRCFSQHNIEIQGGFIRRLWYFSDAIPSNLGFSCLFTIIKLIYKKHKLKYFIIN